MAVGLTVPSTIYPVAGVRLSAVAAGIRYTDRDDLVVMEIASGASCAAVFTRNAFCAAPVIVARQHLQDTSPRYLLINSGNANAGTGKQGLDDCLGCTEILAAAADCRREEILPFSTGVIGQSLPVEAFRKAIPHALEQLDEAGWAQAAAAIMTTDTLPKLASCQLQLEGETVHITGMAKGSGMIRPDMATMLAYIATDASIDQAILDQCLRQAVDRSFNLITVDGDTSTNDACVAIATAQTGVNISNLDNETGKQFANALTRICQELAQAIVRDGEGATKFITIDVSGGADESECRQVADAVAHSPLVKTAFFASDPNWGRILAAVGRSGIADLDVSKIDIYLGDVCIVYGGNPAQDYNEEKGQQVMSAEDITVRVELGRGNASLTMWTCDLSYDYVRINAEYRT
jgi:glutamate N-acetyltransferase/amino-acid N-acetyltransferase